PGPRHADPVAAIALHRVQLDLHGAGVAVARAGHADPVARIALAPIAGGVLVDHVGLGAGAPRGIDAVPAVGEHPVLLDGIAVAGQADAVALVALAGIPDEVLHELIRVAQDDDTAT